MTYTGWVTYRTLRSGRIAVVAEDGYVVAILPADAYGEVLDAR